MSNRSSQSSTTERLPPPQRLRQLLSQVDFMADSQIPSSGELESPPDDNEHNKNRRRRNGPTVDNGANDMTLLKSKFDNAVQLYRFIHENKNEEGKRLSGETRKEKFKEISELYYNLKLDDGPIAQYLTSSKVGWTSFIQDEKYWNLWDDKESIIREDRRRKYGRYDNRYRSRSRDRQSRTEILEIDTVIIMMIQLKTQKNK